LKHLAQKTSEPWRVGVLFSHSGYLSVIEETQLQGTLLAIDEINCAGGINGRELVPIIYDPASDDALFRHYAKRLMTQDRVTSIFGCYTSSSRRAVLPIVERLNGLLWYPTLYEGFEYSPNVIYTGSAPNQNSLALCEYLISTYGRRFYFVGSDYFFPRETNKIMRELLREEGGEVVGSAYLPLRAQRKDFLPIIREIQQASPDVIFSTVVGDATAHLYRSYAEAGLDPKTMPIASLTTTEAEIKAMGFDVGEGHITAAAYFQSLAGDANSKFVNRYKQRFGIDEPTNMCVEAAYFQMHIFAHALERTNSINTDMLRPMILGSEIDAPQGKVAINASCGHTNLWSRIGKANRKGQFDVVARSVTPVVADPYLTSYGRVAHVL
jgi:ABC-type branched-subunit amino acid transport system substrate-binding protein